MQPLAYYFKLSLKLIACAVIVSGCESTDEDVGAAKPAANAPIAPPSSLGQTKSEGHKAIDGTQGYPGADRNDVEVVLPYGDVVNKQRTAEEQRRREHAARATDREVAGVSQDSASAKKLGDVDRALGLESSENGNAPSFTLGVQKIKDLFKEKQFEEALIETNDLLKYYPRSAQLLLMKGTLHQRLSQVDLALTSYERAFEFEPSRKLQAQISSLKQVVREREEMRRSREGVVKPGGAAVKIETIPAIAPAAKPAATPDGGKTP